MPVWFASHQQRAPASSPTTRFPLGLALSKLKEGSDTMNRIAQRYGVTVEALMQANGFIDRGRILRIGERLIIPD